MSKGIQVDKDGFVLARWGHTKFAKPCPCGGEAGTFIYEYRRGIVWSDTWVCDACHGVYYEWTWDTTQTLCTEIRAEVLAEQQGRNDRSSLVADTRKSVVPKKGQLGLF